MNMLAEFICIYVKQAVFNRYTRGSAKASVLTTKSLHKGDVKNFLFVEIKTSLLGVTCKILNLALRTTNIPDLEPIVKGYEIRQLCVQWS